MLQVSLYLRDAATLDASTLAFTELLSPSGHPFAADAAAELQALPDPFALHVLCSFRASLGEVLEAVPRAMWGRAVAANMERRCDADAATGYLSCCAADLVLSTGIRAVCDALGRHRSSSSSSSSSRTNSEEC